MSSRHSTGRFPTGRLAALLALAALFLAGPGDPAFAQGQAPGQDAPPAAGESAPVTDLKASLAEADAALNSGDTARAIALYGKLLEHPALPVSAYPLVFLRRAAGFSAQGDMVEAMADFDAAVELAPDDPSVRFYRGTALLQAGDIRRAIADLDRSIEGQPTNAAALAARARANLLAGDLGLATADVGAALRIAPDYPLALAVRGEIALTQARYRDAVRDFSAAIEREPQLVPAYSGRIAANEALGQWDQVKPDLQRLYLLGDRSPRFLEKAKSYGVETGE